MAIVINGQEYESYEQAYQTGMFLSEDLGGVKEWDDEAEEYCITFTDQSWCWNFCNDNGI